MPTDAPNAHVLQYLQWYLSLAKPPGFAVLIKGAWGSGKSFLVREFIKSQEPAGIKSLYVSLYGLSATSQIDDRMFEQLHPLLSSKPARIVGSLVRSVAKVTIGVDIDGDRKQDAQVNATVPDIDLAGLLNNAKGRILVFDDLERANIDASEILGYINYFVEQHGAKCIVIANDSEVGIDELSKAKYRRIKEKLIGQELSVHPNLDSAFSAFIEEAHYEETKKLLKAHIQLAKEIFEISGVKNLRSMRQAFLGIDRLLPALAKQYRENKIFCDDLLKTYLAFSLEIQSGNMRPEDIPNLMQTSIDDIANEEESALGKIIKKYHRIDLINPMFGGKEWQHILSDGLIHQDVLNNWLSQSSYANPTEISDWIRLWHFADLTADEFQLLEKKVWKKFEAGGYDSVYVVLHVASMMLYFTSERLVDRSVDSIKEVAEKHIRSIMTPDYVLNNFDPNEPEIPSGKRWGLSFLGPGKEFSDLVTLTNGLSRERQRECLPRLGKQLVDMMKQDINEFRAAIIAVGNKMPRYASFPVLKEMDAKAFVDVLLEKTARDRWAIGHALRDRYANMSRFTQDLKEELSFLERLDAEISLRNVGIGLDQYTFSKFKNQYICTAIRRLTAFDPVTIANESVE